MLTLKLTCSIKNKPILLALQGNFVVTYPPEPDYLNAYNNVGAVVCDGIHNNGGWKVRETFDEIMEMINES
jgi:hypothetical protein